MLVEEDPEEPSPDHRLDAERDGATADQVPDHERHPERDRDPEQVEAVEPHDHAILVEILPIDAALLHAEVREHPADMGVREAADGTGEAVTVPDVRRVRVAWLVG